VQPEDAGAAILDRTDREGGGSGTAWVGQGTSWEERVPVSGGRDGSSS
jgi:hypothetical protein